MVDGVDHDEARPATAVVTNHVFWCGVASRAHVIYGAAWLRQLRGEVTVSLFPPRRFLGAEALTVDDVQAMAPDHVTVIPVEHPLRLAAGSRPWLLSVGAVGLKPWASVRRAIGAKRLPVVVTDEGLGSYGTATTRRRSWAREGVREPWRTVRTAAVFGGTAALATSRWRLYLQTPTGWNLNAPVADEFRRHGQRHSADGGVVFLSQPWPELGVMTEGRYMAHVDDVARAAADAGLSFAVRPHPAEPSGRYGRWPVLDGAGLAELDPAILNATAVAGATSTAMLNLAAIHGVPALRVSTPALDVLDRQLSSRQDSLLNHHLGPASPEREWASTLAKLSAASRGAEQE